MTPSFATFHRATESRRYRDSDSFDARGGTATASSLSSPGLRWKDHRGSTSSAAWKRITPRKALLVCLVCVVALTLVPGRRIRGEISTASKLGERRGGTDEDDKALAADDDTLTCNPYDLPGVLIANWTEASSNRWAPIAAAAACQPVDWVALLRAAEEDGTWYPQLEWARNRTIAIFGDSVDRDHVVHTCEFVKGQLERIGEKNPLSPRYPPGQELPPKSYINPFTQKGEWTEDYDQSRPHICHITSYNLRIVSVFHFGFQELTDWLLNYYRYYPPTGANDRFDSVLVPLLHNLGKAHDAPIIPDIVSLSTGFWDILSHSIFDDVAKEEAIQAGQDPGEATLEWDTYRTMSESRRAWFERHIRALLIRAAEAWPEREGKGPKIIWRALHHPQANHLVPITSIQALDSISRGVIAQLQAEGRAAATSRAAWERWRDTAGRLLSLEPVVEEEGRGWMEAKKMDLGRRLRIDEWGSRILGQELRQRDHLHPLPLPSNYLYGNMLFEQLKQAVEGAAPDRASAASQDDESIPIVIQ